MSAQDWDSMAGGMTGILEQEARERSLNRDAIASLRRRSMNAPTSKGKPAASSSLAIPAAPTSHAAREAGPTPAGGKRVVGGRLFAKRPEGRVRRLRSLPGNDPRIALPLGRRDANRGACSTGDAAAIDNSTGTAGNGKRTSDTDPASLPSAPSAPQPRGPDGEGSVEDGAVAGETALWPSAGTGEGAGRRAGRRSRGVSPDVVVTDVMPVRLSCGYCRKHFHVQNLDRHEERCPSRNLDLFATPCVACRLQGPRCACWALRNGLLREARVEPEKPLFALFKNSRAGRKETEDRRQPCAESSTKRAAGFLGGWAAGEGIRRPSPEERWMRERDDWLFGRFENNHSTCHEFVVVRVRTVLCATSRDLVREQSRDGNGGKRAGRCGRNARRDCCFMRHQAFLVRERVQMRSHLEKGMDAAKVRRYTEKWFRFSSNPPKKIRHVHAHQPCGMKTAHGDIPWLPRLSVLLVEKGVGGRDGGTLGAGNSGTNQSRGGPCGGHCLERFETLGVNEGDSSDVKKAALRAASLRWHPDKFMSKYGPSIASEDRSRIAKDVQATMQRITKLRERLH
ncbi:unnamed protein product, partial [Scytosiphon promiscuus]